jgi:hypothetical protein
MTTTTAQHAYPFARLFIKLAILLAILVVLGGIGYAITQFQSMQSELATVKYTPNPALESMASNLEKSYLGTNKRILRSLDIEQFPPTIPLVDFPKNLTTISSANEHAQAQLYLNLSTETLSSVEQIKAYHISEFVKSLEGLQKTLLDHAARLRAQYSTTNPTPTQPRPQSSTQPATAGSFRIYADSPESDRQRLDKIKVVKEFLEYLRSQSRKEESIDQIRRASIYLARAESLLDLLDKSNEDISQPSNGMEEDSSKQEQEQLLAKSEKMAQDVGKVIDIIQEQIYENWTVELQAQSLREQSQEELRDAAIAENKAKQIRNDGYSSIAFSLILSLAIAFIIMVVADFLRAFLNLSNNSDQLVVNTTPS